MTKPDMILYLDEVSGIYIPQRFATETRREAVEGVDAEDWEILEAGPDHELYWDVWQGVLDSAIIHDGGVKYRLHQDGTCWLVPDGMEWNDKTETYEWPLEFGEEALPAHFICYWVNGDNSYLEDWEERAADTVLDALGIDHVIGPKDGEEQYFGTGWKLRFNRAFGDEVDAGDEILCEVQYKDLD